MDQSFYKIIQNANTVIIENISGCQDHIERLTIIADNVGRNCKNLKLFFEGDEVDNVDLAKKYVEIFRKFEAVESIRIDAEGDGNLTNLANEMMKDENFVWFSTVKTFKCYAGFGIKNPLALQTLFTKFKNADTFKGIIFDNFNPLELFESKGKKIRNLSWSIPENQAVREIILKFISFDEPEALKISGGWEQKAELEGLVIPGVRHLYI